MRLALALPDLSRPKTPPPPPPPDPALLAAIREEAEAAGYARGLIDGREEGEATRARSIEADAARCLDAIAISLQNASCAGREASEQSAEALARLLFTTMDLVLARTVARDAATIIVNTMTPLLAAIVDRPEAELRVSPELVATITQRMPSHGPPVIGDVALPLGDAALTWREGGRIVSLSRRRSAVHQALREAGFEIDGLEQNT